MDIKKIIEDAVAKLTKDNNLKAEFLKNPEKVLESKLGIDIPDDLVQKVISGIKAKISVDKISDIAGSLGGLFKK